MNLLFPNYIDDPYSKVFAEILLSSSVEDDNKSYFDYDQDIIKDLDKYLVENIELKEFHHMALLITIKNKGLFCVIKIFDWACALRLSQSESYIISNKIMIVNDAILQTFRLNFDFIVSGYTLITNLESFNEIQRNEILSFKMDGFTSTVGGIPVFDDEGKIIHNIVIP